MTDDGPDSVDLSEIPIATLVAELRARRPERLCLELLTDVAELQEALYTWTANKDERDDESERDAHGAALRIRKVVQKIRRKASAVFRDVNRDARLPPEKPR